jgi:hypothetical protein
VRFTLLMASSALAASLLLSACSSGSGSSAVPGGSQVAAPMSHHGVGEMKLSAVSPLKGKNPCPSSKYLFCADITASSSGPYIEWSACTSGGSCPPTYDLNAQGVITTTKGKSTKDLSSSWSPSPGNPTYGYITEVKPQKASKKVKFIDATSACYANYPSICSNTYDVGLIPT